MKVSTDVAAEPCDLVRPAAPFLSTAEQVGYCADTFDLLAIEAEELEQQAAYHLSFS